MKNEVHTRSMIVANQLHGRDVLTIDGFDWLQHLDIPM